DCGTEWRTGFRNDHQEAGLAGATLTAPSLSPSQRAPALIQSLIRPISRSLSLEPSGIAGCSLPTIRRYSRLLSASPGAIAGPFCPPFTSASELLRSRVAICCEAP